MLEYTNDNDVTDIWYMWDREEAIVLIDGKFYSDDNHQYAMLQYAKDYWTSRNYNLEDSVDMGEAINHTDALFREGKIYGLDLFCDGKGNRYILSHYPNLFNDKQNLALVKNLARERGYRIGTFTCETKLGDKCYLLNVA